MPGRNPDFIPWRKSLARATILEDLVNGTLSLDNNEVPAEIAYEHYRKKPEFAEVVFSQFKARLSDHRKQVKKNYDRAHKEEKALCHDRTLFPRRLKNLRRELVFDLHPAKPILRQMVKEGTYKNKTPREVWSLDANFQVFPLDKFRQRIYQEIRRWKFVNYLNAKREEGHFEI